MPLNTRLSSPNIVSAVLTQIKGVLSTEAAANRNVTNGPGILHAVIVDNQEDSTGNAKVWIKIYDVTSQGWKPGTTLPIIIFPIVVWTAADNSQGLGTYQVLIIPGGMPFENGLSISVSTLDGDDAGANSTTEVDVELVYT